MIYEVKYSKKFKKGMRKLSISDVELVLGVIEILASGEKLAEKYRDHKLKGDFKNCRECHIKPDLLLIYSKQDDILLLNCIGVGNHNELF